MDRSPIGLHTSSALELQKRLEAERLGLPFLIYRDREGAQVIVGLADGPTHVTVGRREGCDVCLDWDPEVSRLHAQCELIGDQWTVFDDGLSRNGSFVNGVRLSGHQRLRDGGALRFGDTAVVFKAPTSESSRPTEAAAGATDPQELSPAHRRVLVALCRPFRDSFLAAPASNKQIADELVLSVETVKTYMRALFAQFGIADLPQNQKRAALAARALRGGIVSTHEL